MPWHRRFVSLYENAMRDECDYEGAMPYVATLLLATIKLIISLQILGLDPGRRRVVRSFS
jgi:Common central domain of tyrosinase